MLVANTDKPKNILIYLTVINNADSLTILLFIGQTKQRLFKITQKIQFNKRKIKPKTNRNNKNKNNKKKRRPAKFTKLFSTATTLLTLIILSAPTN